MKASDRAARSLRIAVNAIGKLKVVSAKELRAVIAAGRLSKHAGYDITVAGMAQRYRGDQAAIVRAALRKRYPHSSEMPVNPINWLAFFARQDAGVYVVPAERWLEEGGRRLVAKDLVDPKTGEVTEKADPRAAAFARALEDLGIGRLMPELERRALTGVKAAAIEIGWRKVEDADEGLPVAHMYWPSDVIVVCHPRTPNDDRSIMVCALRQTPTSAGDDTEVWWVWSRVPTEHADGSVKSWGPWRHVRLTTDDECQAIPVEYPGKLLPILFVRTEQADGGFWPMPEKDALVQVDELNISRSNEQHTVDLQGHGQGVYSGSTLDVDEIPMGPDRWICVGPAEVITSVNFDPHLEDMRASRTQALRETAVSRSNNPDAYATTPTVASSGISRKIANLPHDIRVAELRPVFTALEEQRIHPVVLEVIHLFAPETYAPEMTGSIRGRVKVGSPPDYEELDQKQRRLVEDLKNDIISEANYAVQMGHFDTEDLAEASGLSKKLRRAMATPTPALPAAPSATPAPSTPPSTTPLPTPTPTPATPADAVAAAAPETVQDTALNGAQVEALLALVDKVAAKSLPPAAVEQLLSMAFPAISLDKIKALLRSLDGFKPAPPAPPAPPAG